MESVRGHGVFLVSLIYSCCLCADRLAKMVHYRGAVKILVKNKYLERFLSVIGPGLPQYILLHSISAINEVRISHKFLLCSFVTFASVVHRCANQLEL